MRAFVERFYVYRRVTGLSVLRALWLARPRW
jgi:hypothetical protein